MPSLPYGGPPGRGETRWETDSVRTSDNKRPHIACTNDEKRAEDDGESPRAARVWDMYRDEATQSDERMLNGWNKTLDVLLIFAGVFSAIATAFIVESNDQLRPDWNEYTARMVYAVLLAQTAAGNSTAGLLDPSAFSAMPVSSISRWISGLWVCSLALSLVVSLFCILAKQWLIEYHARVSGSVPSAQQWCRRRSLFFVGLEAWRLPLVFAALPALLHLSLFLFMVGLVLFFWALHRIVAICLLVITCCIAIFYLAAGLVTFYDIACPYYMSLFHQLHTLLGHLYSRRASFPRHVYHVTEANKLRLDAATLAWLSATSTDRDVIATSITAVLDNFVSTPGDDDPAEQPPNPRHMLQILEALRVLTYTPEVPDPRVDTALVIFQRTLAGARIQEYMLRELVNALSDLCLGYPVGDASPVPVSIGDARFDAIALLAHISVEGAHYSLTRAEVLIALMSQIWSPNLFGDLGLTPVHRVSDSLFELSVEPSTVMVPLSAFVASPTFLAAKWTERDIATLGNLFVQPGPLPDLVVGGEAMLNLLQVAVLGHATFSSIFSVIQCIRCNPAAGIYIIDTSTEQFHPWRQLCCTVDSPSMSEGDKEIIAPLLLECAVALSMEIWRQHTGTDSATRLGRELLDAHCMAPILRGPVLGAHWRRLYQSSFILRGRTTGRHSAEHLFLNMMPALLPGTWRETWDGIVARASTDVLDPEVSETLRSITLRLQQRGHVVVEQQVPDQILSRVTFPRTRMFTRF